MFSPTLGRVIRSTCAISNSACSLGRPATLSTVPQSLSRPPHHRRLSSSKASIPPNGSNANGPNSPEQTKDVAPTKTPTRKPAKTTRKRVVATPALNVPHVPPTDHLRAPGVGVSSFFSLHRPISVKSAIPPVATNASFDAIFQPLGDHTNRNTLLDNIRTLSGEIESIEAVLRAEGKLSPYEIAQSEADTQHLDGPPSVTAEHVTHMVAKFVPFRPPPVPIPSDQEMQSDAAVSQPLQEATTQAAAVKQRVWSTSVVVTESTDSQGKKTYSATSEPMVEILVPTAENNQDLDDVDVRQPFLERMRQRQNTNPRYRDMQKRPDMLAISVKRQRKLKMKKHKYKKLMKRTRLLRRKLDRT
ncbi:hypothetical protein K504DRAFT_501200 [Pleomassaria siparia CBS 279.74]|uniref:Small ribosomal subunit protein mS38 n=1 Tax=Pleomassaria siparia CBS 279.74 TaxID=1314801 RepID=A0A6G1KAP8_9PLEO|nr:hypothetical protein K504DRAFT_501200 [Pleomassaria siparia CBS 279.74]